MDYHTEVIQLFQMVKSEFESYGKIEVDHKELLLKKMREVEGGEKFADEMLQAFEEMENSDDNDDSDESDDSDDSDDFHSNVLIPFSGKRSRKSKIITKSLTKPDRSDVLRKCFPNTNWKDKTKAKPEDPKIRRRKLKFDIALTVFKLFQVKCHFESTCEEVFATTSNESSGTEASNNVSTSRTSTLSTQVTEE